MKIISIIMAVVITITTLMGSMPMNSQAATSPNTSFDSNMSIEGTNSFGNLLAEKLDSEIAEQTQSIGYNVFSAEVTGTEVTVEFETMSDCTLLAGIYDETREKLIATGTAEVLTGETEKIVNIEIEEMPQYFYLKVYLIDETTMRPMCTAYESSLYTKEMQEFLAKTVDDFDSERVLNIDEDETNNFAVYGEDVAVVESDETVNVVTTVDTENEKYVIENADSAITSLKTDDVVAIEQTSGEILIVKVGEIDIDGTTVTITGQDTNLEEVFDYVKIDVTQNSSEAFYDDSYASEGVTPVNVSKNILPDINGINNKKAIEEEVSGNLSSQYSIGVESNAASITGSVNLNAAVELKLYLSLSKQYVEFTIENNHEVEIAFTGSVSEEITITKFIFPLLPCLAIDVDIKFVLEASVSVSVKGVLTQTVGFSFDSNLENPVKNLTTKPMLETSINVQGTVFVGISVSPSIVVFGEQFFEAGFESTAGVEISASMSVCEISTNYTPEMKHECEKCIEGELSAKVTVGGFITLFNCDDLTFKIEHEIAKVPICDFYYSFDHKDFGLTTCPHQLYRLTIEVLDENGKPAAGALLTINGSASHATNKNGICNVYFSEDENVEIKAIKDKTESYRKFKMPGSVFKQRMHLRESEKTSVTTKPITTTSNKTTNKVTTSTTTPIIKANGTCGRNLTWVLDDGTLTISGTGDMDFGGNTKAPWAEYSDYIKKAVIKDGITSIEDYAFWSRYKLLSAVEIPESVTSIGKSAFYGCQSLNEIVLPKSVSVIGESAFYECKSIVEITIPNNVKIIDDRTFEYCTSLNKITIPDSVTSIGERAFADCTSLTEISLPSSITNIGEGAFEYCEQLKEIDIPKGITEIKNCTFRYCTSLTSITIPDRIKTIGNDAFHKCTGLTSITIPDNVESIGDWAFCCCEGLKSVSLSNNMVKIGNYAFQYCKLLTEIVIPDGVTSIGEYTFAQCSSLTEIVIPDNVTYIGEYAFINCDSLTDVIIPEGVTTLEKGVFNRCNLLAKIEIPDSVTSIGEGAFEWCASLTEITIPDSVTYIGNSAFLCCDLLTKITIPDSVTSIGEDAFDWCDSLTSITIKNPKCEIYDDYYTISDTATIYGYSGSTAQAYAEKHNRKFVAIDIESQALSLSNLKTSTNLKKSAVQKSDMTEVFTDLLPNEVYNFYVMKSKTAENPLSADNLLYITQAVSDENGGLTISYIPKEACDTAEIFVAGLTRKDISAAEITIPEIVFNGEEMIVTPDVVFEGKTLVEGEDYNIESGYLVTAPGEYTITINGIGDYTNVKEVTYTVISGDNNSADTDIVYGDANCDGQVTMADAAAVFMAIGNADKYGLSEKGTLNADCSGTGDGITPSDAIAIQKLLINLIDKLPI